MKKKKNSDGSEEIEGTAKELAEYENSLEEDEKKESKIKNKNLLLG